MEKIELKLPLEVINIQKCIPHRYPFLLLDRILELEPFKSIKALKNISVSDPLLAGHFPDNPVYPGVLIVESMAQASSVLGYFSRSSDLKTILLTEISESRFRQMVLPGSTLIVEVVLERERGPFAWFDGKASVDGQVVASAKFSACMK